MSTRQLLVFTVERLLLLGFHYLVVTFILGRFSFLLYPRINSLVVFFPKVSLLSRSPIRCLNLTRAKAFNIVVFV